MRARPPRCPSRMQQVERHAYAVSQFPDEQERLVETRRLLRVSER